MKIIGGKGRTLNLQKRKMRTPQSDTDREINGLTFTPDGKRGICKQKKSQIIRQRETYEKMTKREIERSSFYRKKFKIGTLSVDWDGTEGEEIVNKILNSIDGMYRYVVKIYGKNSVPRVLEKTYRAAKKKRENYDEWKEKIENKKNEPKITEKDNQDLKKNSYKKLPEPEKEEDDADLPF